MKEVWKLNPTKLPKKIIIEENAIQKIPDILKNSGDFHSILCVIGKKTHGIVGKDIKKILTEDGYKPNFVFVKACDEKTIFDIQKKGLKLKTDLIMGIGGGKNIDVAKAVASHPKRSWVSVPTIPSHDGIASDRSVVSKGKTKYPVLGNPPIAVIADTVIIAKAPFRYFAAGCGDVISKITAVLDWQLARDNKGESYDDYAANLAYSSAETIIKNAKNYRRDFESSIKILMKCLINCGTAMLITKSSRPCSGSEHMFCHTIDKLFPENKVLHGEKVALGTYIMSYLHGIDHEEIKDALISYKLPTNSKQIKIPSKILVEVLSTAHKIRSDMRYTILRNGIDKKDARNILKKLKVI